MKKYIYLLFLIVVSSACEDVIDVSVPSEDSRLVIDALIRVDSAQPTTHIEIKASTTSSFFDEIQPAQLKNITLTNTESSTSINLTEENTGTGIYTAEVATKFLTQGEIQLTINYNQQLYTAATTYVPSVPIDNLEQGNKTLFNEEDKEVIITYTDAANRTDFYLFDFGINEYLVTEDTFYQDQEFKFSYFSVGTTITISILGIDEGFYRYMDQLLVASGDNFGPFQTPTATIRGNIVNRTNSNSQQNNFALGYFAISEVFSNSITIQ